MRFDANFPLAVVLNSPEDLMSTISDTLLNLKNRKINGFLMDEQYLKETGPTQLSDGNCMTTRISLEALNNLLAIGFLVVSLNFAGKARTFRIHTETV